MCVFNMNTALQQSKDYSVAGQYLYKSIKEAIANNDRLSVDMDGVTSLPSVFLNVSLGRIIDEEGTVEVTEDMRTVFEVGEEFNISGLLNIREVSLGRPVFARSDAPDVESPDTVGSTDIELLRIRCHPAVAIAINHSRAGVGRYRTLVGYLPQFCQFCFYLKELSIRVLEHCLPLLVPFVTGTQVSKRHNIC